MEETTGIIGAGGWGTALSLLLHRKGRKVILWEVFPSYERILKKRRENIHYLPGIAIPGDVRITSSLAVVSGCDALIVAVPSHYFRETLAKLKPVYRGQPVLIATKGLEQSTGRGMMEVAREVLGKKAHCAILSGPTIAREAALGCPLAAAVASADPAAAEYFQKMLSSETFRLYTNRDVRGVELGGALKNVMAIGAGVIDGLGLGVNTKAAYMSRALHEMTVAGVRLGAEEKTFRGLAGIGDLITTCFSPHSRNRSFGQALAENRGKRFLAETRMAVEGIDTVKSLHRLARRRKIELPITETIYGLVYLGRSPVEEIKRLMTRKLREE